MSIGGVRADLHRKTSTCQLFFLIFNNIVDLTFLRECNGTDTRRKNLFETLW
jgi:hypothetical protein